MSWIDRLKVTVRVGDLFEREADAFGLTLRTDLQPYGRLSQAVFKGHETALLEALRAEAIRRRGEAAVPLGAGLSIPVLPEYGLSRATTLAFAAMWSDENVYTKDLAYSCYASILREAFQRECRSLAVPIFSLGADRSGALAGETLAKLLWDFDELRGADAFPVVEMAVVSDDGARVAGVRKALEPFIDRS